MFPEWKHLPLFIPADLLSICLDRPQASELLRQGSWVEDGCWQSSHVLLWDFVHTSA